MSVSPFGDPATFTQSTMTFKVAVGQGGIDEWGNPVSQVDDITLLAWLDTAGQVDSGLESNEAGEGISIPCEGYLTDPMFMPPELIHGAKGHGVINGLPGEVVLQPILPDNLSPAREALGDRIKIKFRSRVQWGGGV